MHYHADSRVMHTCADGLPAVKGHPRLKERNISRREHKCCSTSHEIRVAIVK